MTSYFIEASVCLAGFYAFYWLFLHREKLLSINRYYLLITSFLALIIPLLDFKYKSSSPTAIMQPSTRLDEVSTSAFSLDSLPLGTIYSLGLSIALLLFSIRLFRAIKQLKGTFSYNRHKPAIVEVPGNTAYSFFNTIFIGKKLMEQVDLRNQILAHEMAHIRDRHFLDLLYFELVKCVFWFNPFPYLYSKSLKLQHEYIADQKAMAHTSAETYEQSLIRFTLSKIDNTLVAAFGQHPIQQRLNMIYKLNSNIMNKLKPLLCLPIAAVFFFSYSCSQEPLSDVDTTPEPEIVESETVVTGTVVEIRDATNIEADAVFVEDGIVVEGSEATPVEVEEIVYEEYPSSENVFNREIALGQLVEIIEEEVPVNQLRERKAVPVQIQEVPVAKYEIKEIAPEKVEGTLKKAKSTFKKREN